MFKYLSTLVLIFLAQQCSEKPTEQVMTDKKLNPIPFVELPKKLDESSGLEVVNDRIYSINDSGGKPELFVFNKEGKELDNIKIKNAENKDWESLAANQTHFFIGDFGNNSGNRKDLSIYYFPIANLNKDKIKANKLTFKYSNQPHFHQKKRKHEFDGEALMALDDALIIFSKDWLNQNSQVYHLPLNSKDETLNINPSEKLKVDALITGADYNESSQRLALVGYQNNHNFVWIFENATKNKFLTNTFEKYELDGLYIAQVEGVAFYNENQLLISTEKTKKFDQQLWLINLN